MCNLGGTTAGDRCPHKDPRLTGLCGGGSGRRWGYLHGSTGVAIFCHNVDEIVEDHQEVNQPLRREKGVEEVARGAVHQDLESRSAIGRLQ